MKPLHCYPYIKSSLCFPPSKQIILCSDIILKTLHHFLVMFDAKCSDQIENRMGRRKNIFYQKKYFLSEKCVQDITSSKTYRVLLQQWATCAEEYSFIFMSLNTGGSHLFTYCKPSYLLPRQRRNILKVDVRYDDIYSGMTEMKWWFTQLQNLQVHSVICKSDLNSDLSFSSDLCSSAVQCSALLKYETSVAIAIRASNEGSQRFHHTRLTKYMANAPAIITNNLVSFYYIGIMIMIS